MDRLDAKREQIAEVMRERLAADQMSNWRVADCMTPAPLCIESHTSVADIVRLYHAKQFRHLLVTDIWRGLVGVVSDRDVLRCFGPDGKQDLSYLNSITAAEIMSRDIVLIDAELPITQALRLLLLHGINCLPVQREGQLVGILTGTDLHIMLEALLVAHESGIVAPRSALNAV
ncbi:MAG: CBS domain-containing protein [Pirellulales bacterium]|nr:CBS domain-containing protein [Pirellulales bacterium]